MSQPVILVAMRIDAANANRRVPFTGRAVCSQCDAEVMIAPSSKAILEAGATIVCLACAKLEETTNFLPLNPEQLREIRKYVADRN